LKKILTLILIVAFIVSMLFIGTSCKGEEAAEEEVTEEEVAEEEAAEETVTTEKTDIKIWYYWESPIHQEVLNTIVSDFNASQERITVSADYIPFADFKKQLSVGVAAEELPDLVIIDNPDHAAYAAMGIFADLTDELSSWPDLGEYYHGPLASCTIEGKIYGIPFGSNCLALYYNEDMLASAGCEVPTTWDELKDVAEKTTTDGVIGFAICSLPNEEGTFGFLPWLWSTGATSYEINSEGGIKALTLYKDLIESGSMSTEVINWTQGDVMNQFISGNIAMMINGPWQVPRMRSEAPEELNWNVALIPKDEVYSSDLGGENFAIINNENVSKSLEFLLYAVSAEKVREYIDNFGYIASRKDVAKTQYTDDPIMQKFIEQMEYALPRGPHEKWPEISNAISAAFNEVITGVADPEIAAANAQTTIDSILE